MQERTNERLDGWVDESIDLDGGAAAAAQVPLSVSVHPSNGGDCGGGCGGGCGGSLLIKAQSCRPKIVRREPRRGLRLSVSIELIHPRLGRPTGRLAGAFGANSSGG